MASMASLDKHYMSLALKLARDAYLHGEVPVGALVVVEGKICGWGSNRRMDGNRILGHAELIALETASEMLGNWRLMRSTLYVTLEPCIMCTGALLQSRVDRVVFGCRDPKAGAMRSLFALGEDPRLNHRIRVDEGIYADESARLLRDFFDNLRLSKK
jgi:tRNA(adenine34) deaminase